MYSKGKNDMAPQYSFENEKGEVIDAVLGIHEDHSTIEKDGVEYKRIFSPPQIGIDCKWDAESSTDFTIKSGKKRGTLNDIWSKSAELSEKREKIHGEDLIKKKSIEENRKLRHGLLTPQELRENRSKGLEIDLKLPKK